MQRRAIYSDITVSHENKVQVTNQLQGQGLAESLHIQAQSFEVLLSTEAGVLHYKTMASAMPTAM